jgi:quinol monooxygenase YgiN
MTMLALIATMKVQAGKEAEFEKVFLALAKEVRAKEPGNHLYTLTKDSDGAYHVLEIYEDQAALDAHGKTEHFKAAGPKLGPTLAGRPEIKRLTVIG